MQKTIEKTGVVIEKNGKFWHNDEHCRDIGWGPIEDAGIHDPQFCLKPEDVTYVGSPFSRDLKSARLVPIVVTTTYAVEV